MKVARLTFQSALPQPRTSSEPISPTGEVEAPAPAQAAPPTSAPKAIVLLGPRRWKTRLAGSEHTTEESRSIETTSPATRAEPPRCDANSGKTGSVTLPARLNRKHGM